MRTENTLSMTRRRFISLAGLATAGLVAAACQPAGPTAVPGETPSSPADVSAPTAVPSDEPVTIQYACWGGPTTDKAEKPTIDLFHQRQPKVRVEVQNVPNDMDFYPKVLTQIAAGTPPDVFYIGEVWVWSFAATNAVTDLSPYIQRDGIDESIWYEAAYQDLKYDGKPYAIPTYVGPYIMYYSKERYQDAGLKEPIENPTDMWTLDRFLSDAKQLTKRRADGTVESYGAAPWATWLEYIPAIWSFGGDVINEERTQSLLDAPEAIAAFQFIVDMMLKEPKVAPSPSDISGAGTSVWDMVNNQQCVLAGAGRWGAWQRHNWDTGEPLFDWGVAPWPMHKAFATPVLFVSWGIAAGSKLKDAAWEWVKFVTANADVQILYNSSGLGIPIMKEAADTRKYLFDYEPATNHDIYVASLNKARGLPYHPAWSKTIDEVVWQELELMWNGEKSVEEAAKAAARRMNEELAKQKQ